MRCFNCKKLLTGDERVAERLVYSIFFDTKPRDRSANGVDGLLAAFHDKRLEVGLHAVAKAQVSAQFKQQPTGGVTSTKATRATEQEANPRTRGRPRSRENRRRNPTSPSSAHTLKPKSSTSIGLAG
jgi:hypothetical protein